MRPSLSVAMIVRNESEQLSECLQTLATFADELCVVDTGSDDDTPQIARRFGCKTGEFVWCNDFSEARNASLALCTGTWVLVIDADERIDPSDGDRLRTLIAEPAHCGYRFITRNYTNAAHLSEFVPCVSADPWARGFSGWHPSGKVRLFPNRVGVHFEGRIHELANPSLERLGLPLMTSDIPIHHYPFLKSPEQVHQKQRMYLEMGMAKVCAYPHDAKARAELGAQYAELGDYQSAAAAYREAVRCAPDHVPYLNELGAMLYLMGRKEDALRALQTAIQLDPALGDAWRNLGVVYGALAEWEKALDCFDRARQAMPENSEVHRSRAVALEKLGRIVEAADNAREALRLNPCSVWARELFIHQMDVMGQSAAAEIFMRQLRS